MNLLDIIYPPRCPMCGDIIIPGKGLVCPDCAPKLPYVGEPACARCGKALEKEEKEYCFDCGRRNHFFDQGVSVWSYNEMVKNSIYRYKYRQKREYAALYIEELAKVLVKRLPYWKPELLLPIPVHKTRLRQRGYNQAALLADGLSRRFSIPVREDILVRRKKTRPQKELSVQERRNNLRQAFAVNTSALTAEAVVLVDDIYTTGATVDVAAELLKKAGVSRVYFITLASGYGL